MKYLRHASGVAAIFAGFCPAASPAFADRLTGPLVLVDERSDRVDTIYAFRTDGGSAVLPVADPDRTGAEAFAWRRQDIARLLEQPGVQYVETPAEGHSGTVSDGAGYCLERGGMQVKWTACNGRATQAWTMLKDGYLLSTAGLPATLGYAPETTDEPGASVFHSPIVRIAVELLQP
ncbi:hypothetical protein EC912_10143 [Luteibacter rhizovicinus]|uniref:Ricin-type beta-trefoil lectin protein n=1 Tax=Luteibacter rhizovicinus TaxID=242606 RepID=A0A4V2W4S6_9GAMM|nr:hypothetical protein [Luteibacter rhizovicinus]TCV97049.1 hypothetical protein EC912_10143 [Luteibacter rhizovicinus]